MNIESYKALHQHFSIWPLPHYVSFGKTNYMFAQFHWQTSKNKNKRLDRQLLKYQKVIFMFAVLGHVQLKLDNNNRCYQKKKKKFFVYKL